MIIQNPNKSMFGIDVSHHNGIIDWKTAATKNSPKVDFVYIKCSEGANGKDNMFLKNVKGCKDNNLKWGPYHFATWNLKPVERDAAQEAQFFLSQIQISGKPDMPAILDIESNVAIPYTKAEMVAYIKTFTDIFKAAGYPIGIYGSPGFLNSYLPSNHPFIDLPLWIADYTGAINPVPGWKKVWMHQYTESGTINGVPTPGKTDLNKLI